MYIIVGLGNPSKQYEGTRHNAGFMTLDVLADRYNIDISEKKHKALCGKGVIEGNKVVLLKPQTFMNLSGESVRAAADFYKVAPEEIIVIYDDISLEPGQLRVRKKGSAGGHNGMKNIIAHLAPRISRGSAWAWERSLRAWIWRTTCWAVFPKGSGSFWRRRSKREPGRRWRFFATASSRP